MAKIVTMGEIMLRLSSPGQKRFVQSDSFDVVYGGGEANVAVSCANYGHEAYFVSPDFVIASPKNLHQRVWRFSDALPSTLSECIPPCSEVA